MDFTRIDVSGISDEAWEARFRVGRKYEDEAQWPGAYWA
jgi:hypothetical protein